MFYIYIYVCIPSGHRRTVGHSRSHVTSIQIKWTTQRMHSFSAISMLSTSTQLSQSSFPNPWYVSNNSAFGVHLPKSKTVQTRVHLEATKQQHTKENGNGCNKQPTETSLRQPPVGPKRSRAARRAPPGLRPTNPAGARRRQRPPPHTVQLAPLPRPDQHLRSQRLRNKPREFSSRNHGIGICKLSCRNSSCWRLRTIRRPAQPAGGSFEQASFSFRVLCVLHVSLLSCILSHAFLITSRASEAGGRKFLKREKCV